MLRCDSAAIKATRLKFVESLYVLGTRFGAHGLRWVKAAESLHLWQGSPLFGGLSDMAMVTPMAYNVIPTTSHGVA